MYAVARRKRLRKVRRERTVWDVSAAIGAGDDIFRQEGKSRYASKRSILDIPMFCGPELNAMIDYPTPLRKCSTGRAIVL
jgi:hypothetical protein